ncbi:hypothetical protein [Bifidobacterium coryneforme]|uniref:hypothetical protein n=1 Tax=Bifidobacterium coryneforme TaxID=1687 RepID=UPI0004E5E503|nr:hypothetical protein BCOR_0870 [Bifidobacterium coryneforme]
MHWVNSFTGTTAAWVAAFISFISVVINLWIPNRHRPQASFTLIEHLGPIPLFRRLQKVNTLKFTTFMNAHVAYHLQNVGDGAGYNLSISFVDCYGRTTISTEQDPYIPTINRVFSTNDDLWVFVKRNSLCKSSALEVHWVTPPTRLNHCRYQRISIPTSPHKWEIASRISETGGQWFLHRSWHHRDRTGQLRHR